MGSLDTWVIIRGVSEGPNKGEAKGIERGPEVRDTKTGRFAPGNKTGGRWKLPPESREILEAATPQAARRWVEALDATKIVMVSPGEFQSVPDHKIRTETAKMIFERLIGKPAQAITDAEGNAVPFGIMILPSKAEE